MIGLNSEKFPTTLLTLSQVMFEVGERLEHPVDIAVSQLLYNPNRTRNLLNMLQTEAWSVQIPASTL